MNRCRQCGRPTVAELCEQCTVRFSPTPPRPGPEFAPAQSPRPGVQDPYAILGAPSPAPPPPERRSALVAVGVGLGVVGLAAAVGLTMLLGGGSPDAATPAATTTASVTSSAEERDTPSAIPIVVVTVTAPTTSPVAGRSAPSEGSPPEQEFHRFYPLSRGDGGHVVEALQGLLTFSGVRAYVDGDFGAATERAVRQWQAQQGLTVNGVVDDTTWDSLTPRLQKGSSGDAVTVLQKLLTARGYEVAVDGDFGNQTLNAVTAFQSDRGLTVDGLVGPQTWAALLS